jgi:hypothetical protein
MSALDAWQRGAFKFSMGFLHLRNTETDLNSISQFIWEPHRQAQRARRLEELGPNGPGFRLKLRAGSYLALNGC